MKIVSEVGVELSRMRHRRTIVILVALGFVAVLATLGFAIKHAVPPSASDKAAALQQAERDWDASGGQRQYDDCVAQRDTSGSGDTGSEGDAGSMEAPDTGDSDMSPSGSSGVMTSGVAVPVDPGNMYPADFDCEDLKPQASWYLDWREPDFVSDYGNTLKSAAMTLSLVLALAGMTFVGADFSAGTIGTQLLYQPRRLRMLAVKAGALALVGFVAGAVGAVLTWIVSYADAAAWGSTEMVDQVNHRTLVGGSVNFSALAVQVTGWTLAEWALRAAVLVALGAIGGFVLATIFRSSLVSLGLLAAYGIVGEGLLAQFIPSIQPYLLSPRVMGWLHGPYQVVHYPNQCGPGGQCLPTIYDFSVTGGGVYLLIVVALGLVLAGWSFTRRDIN